MNRRWREVIKKLRSEKLLTRNSTDGFSLVELLVTLAIFGILMATVTSIIVVNLRVARRIKARTYVREETAFMLNVLKKDLRNADNVICVDKFWRDVTHSTPPCNLYDPAKLRVIVADPNTPGLDHIYDWTQTGNRISRLEGTNPTYMTPSDVEFNMSVPLRFDIFYSQDNSVVKITLQAWTLGMPGDPSVPADPPQWLRKEVAVSTRNFEF